MPSKLLMLGLDAAEPTLLRRWAGEGKLPAIRALTGRGISGSVHGVEGFYVGSTWPSFYTGLNPAGHGFHRVDQLASGSYDFYRPLDTPTGVGGTPFWKLASDAGRRVAVLDVPLARLDPHLNGIQIVEWGGQEYMGFRTSPSTLAKELLATVGEYPVPRDADVHSADGIEEFVTRLERGIAAKTELTLELLDRDDWDLFTQVFLEAHYVGHQCWHVHDPAHPAHDPHLLAALSDPVERVYRALDRAVGDIVEHAGDNHILVFSLHGMSAYRGANFLLREMLYRIGVMARPAVPPSSPDGLGNRLAKVPRTAWKLLPGAAREAIRPLRTRLAKPAAASIGEGGSVSGWADVGASRCFSVPNGSPVSGIRLNLVGREPKGVLRPGSEADAFCEQLASDLLAITDERTGSPLIAAVVRTDSLYAGPRRDALPDLLVQWSDAPTGTLAHADGRGATVRARSETIGVVEGQNRYHRTGDHNPTGLFVFAGPGISAATRDPVRVTDFHPTICRLLDLPTTAVDGEVVPELVVPLSC